MIFFERLFSLDQLKVSEFVVQVVSTVAQYMVADGTVCSRLWYL